VLRHRPDLVFFDLVGLARAATLPLPGLRPRRYAVFAHGIELSAATRGSRRRALRGAWRILTNSHFTARGLAAEHPDLGDRIVPTPLCIDPERTAAWEAAAPAERPERRPAVLIVGRLWSSERGKGHEELLACWPRVRDAHPSSELWVVGDGDDRARLEARARELGVDRSVRFFGRVSDAELGRLYRTASLFAMPSRQEGFGLVYAEAMWHGLPCIGSTADAATEVIVDGETGALVPYGEAEPLGDRLIEMLGDLPRLERMGEAAARRARLEYGYPRFRKDLLTALELD
jgi:phosphatidylinositol alpha-1,6-mannosyltransferase